jgi:hypothetical protein
MQKAGRKRPEHHWGSTIAPLQSFSVLAIISILGHLAVDALRRQRLIQSSRFVGMTAVRIHRR